MVPESLGVPGKKRITEGEQKRREERNYAEKQPYRAEEKEEMKAEIEEEEEDELNRSDVDPSEVLEGEGLKKIIFVLEEHKVVSNSSNIRIRSLKNEAYGLNT